MGLVFVEHNVWIAVALLSGALLLGRFAVASYWVNMIEVAPQCSAQLMGVSNTIATVPVASAVAALLSCVVRRGSCAIET